VTPVPQRLAALPRVGFLSLSSGLGVAGLGVGVEGFSCKYLELYNIPSGSRLTKLFMKVCVS
jgi:hypothetical protein